MIESIKEACNKFKNIGKKNIVEIISHYDTDGITSAAIICKAFQREDIKFHLKIIKQIDENVLQELKGKTQEIIFFLDLGSNFLEELSQIQGEIFVLDHHEIIKKEVGKNINFINPHNFQGDIETSAAALTYLFCKSLNEKNKELAVLAVIGMVGDMAEKNLSKLNNEILKDSEVIVKKGPLIFSATRPISRALEFSSDFFIPGITGSSSGVINLLREVGIDPKKILADLNDDEISKLVTSLIVKNGGEKGKNIIGNIYLLKFFNRIEDIRELSTLINACSRLDFSDIALSFCMGDNKARMKAESIYNTYKHEIISGLGWAENNKVDGNGYVIINSKNNIKDTMIGTITSIIASSFIYKEGTVIAGLAYRGDKVKVSSRIVGRNGNGTNLHKLLNSICEIVGGEAGGHAQAAGCLISKDKEEMFIEQLKKEFDIEGIKIKI